MLRESQEVIGPVDDEGRGGRPRRRDAAAVAHRPAQEPGRQATAGVVPPDLYARWVPLKERYVGKDDDVKAGDRSSPPPGCTRRRCARRGFETTASSGRRSRSWRASRSSKVTEPEVTVKVEKPRAAIKEFKHAPLDDLDCFAKTIERLESDLDLMKRARQRLGGRRRGAAAPAGTRRQRQRLHRRGDERPGDAGSWLHRLARAPRGSLARRGGAGAGRATCRRWPCSRSTRSSSPTATWPRCAPAAT